MKAVTLIALKKSEEFNSYLIKVITQTISPQRHFSDLIDQYYLMTVNCLTIVSACSGN
jgi:hypothetical protein